MTNYSKIMVGRVVACAARSGFDMRAFLSDLDATVYTAACNTRMVAYEFVDTQGTKNYECGGDTGV